MIRKRNPLDDTMTFGTGLPMDISGIEPPSEVPARVLPSQFPPMVQPMECAFIKNTFQSEKTPPQPST